ncbi:Y-family DNA polymerase [Methylocystis heyeri]|uniref:DNA-directed DNA polymerase n=1 Tax=Methylocystis heyeri TaxID=391905 RepID=A0A6B8KH57_9HYPH|nr:DNA polymerase Y family protein [Methylocystis heyeri]QGM47057.1 DNA polymerase Y family protein [Methylocystis heyeri]
MRFLSVFLPRLPTDRILRRGGDAAERPFALWRKVKGAERIVAVNAAAQRRKVFPGMAVADARALYPALALEENDPESDAAMLEAVADWHRRFTPLAALDAPDGVMLDVTGAAQLFGGEASLLEEIGRRLAAQGFCARTALAPGPALARALARFSDVNIVPAEAAQEDIDAAAAELPIAALGLAEGVLAAMARAGLRRIGDLLARPRAPLAARFGERALTSLDALTCRIRDPITPRFEAPAFMAERRFPDGLTQLADIEATLRRLADELRPLLEREGVGARELEAVFYRVDGAVKRVRTGTSRPLRDPARIFALLRERLARLREEDGLDAGFGFDVLRLCADAVERMDDEQNPLGLREDESAAPGALDIARPVWASKGTPYDRSGDKKSHQNQIAGAHSYRKSQSTFAECALAPDLADIVDRLGARLGLRRVLRLYPQQAHLPEFAIAAIPAAYPAPSPSVAPDLSHAAAAREGFAPTPSRPARLFERPEPIEAMALAPDGPPLRFRWRRALHETVAFEGPERIAPPWWRAPKNAFTRDYFSVVDREGRRFWIYREGLLGEECACAPWFVHGLF